MINTARQARGLLDWIGDERPLADRASLLPIGQYDDGSLTFAWPGFLKEAWEGGTRSLVGQEGNPLFDDGGRYVSGAAPHALDAFNMAGVAPFGSLATALKASKNGLSDVLFGSRNANIFDPPARPQRPFEADYPGGARADETGRLTHTIDGDPIVPGATVVGRRTLGGADEALSPTQYDAIAEGLFGQRPQMVPRANLPRKSVGAFAVVPGADRPGYRIRIDEALRDAPLARVTAHEIGHGIDYLATSRFGIPQDGIKRELASVYNTLNNPNRSRDRLEAVSWGKPARPQDFGYSGDDIPAEHMAEAIRAYMTDPNYLKTTAPQTAARIREYVNANPRLSRVIQFNVNAAPAAGPGLLPDYGREPGGILGKEPVRQRGLLAY